MDAHDIAKVIADNAKNHKWLNQTFQMTNPNDPDRTISVGVKAYGKWVQRIECCGLVDGLPEQTTLKALKEKVVDLIQSMSAKHV